MGTPSAGKTGHRGDHRPRSVKTSQRGKHRPLGGKTGHRGDHRLWPADFTSEGQARSGHQCLRALPRTDRARTRSWPECHGHLAGLGAGHLVTGQRSNQLNYVPALRTNDLYETRVKDRGCPAIHCNKSPLLRGFCYTPLLTSRGPIAILFIKTLLFGGVRYSK